MKGPERDPYSILGVSIDATEQQVRAAYRRLARQLHPDSSREDDPTAARRLAEARDAHRLLLDPVQRAALDARLRPAETPTSKRATESASSQTAAPPKAPPSAQPPTTDSVASRKAVSPHPADEQRPVRGRTKVPEPAAEGDESTIDIDLPLDDLWDTSPPVPTAAAWLSRPVRVLRAAVRATCSPQPLLALATIAIGLIGCVMMGADVMPMLGAAVLVAAPVGFYVVSRVVS